MKKLMIAAAVVVAAVASQAATFSWSSGNSKLYGVTAASVGDNGSYSAATSGTTDRGDYVLNSNKSDTGTLTYTLTLFLAGEEIGQATGKVGYGTLGKINTTGITINDAEASTTYDYTFVLTGDQKNLSGRGEEAEYDYSNARVTAEYSGSLTTPLGGTLDLSTVGVSVPTSWTVSGVVSVPEPTSGLLLLLGVAGLALRRKQK